MLCPYCNRNQMYTGANGLLRCPYCHDVVARRAEKPELSKIRQDSESLPSYFLRGYDCEHKRLSPDGDCLDCGA